MIKSYSASYLYFNTGEYARDLIELSYNNLLNNLSVDGGIITNYGDKQMAGVTVEALFLLKNWVKYNYLWGEVRYNDRIKMWYLV